MLSGITGEKVPMTEQLLDVDTTTRKRLPELQAKAVLHSAFAQAFNYPDAKLVESLMTGEFVDTICQSLAALGHTSASEDVSKLKQEYPNSADRNQLLLEFERDYTRMFFASKPRLAHLFESVYREGKLLQESTFEIARLYHDAGLHLNDDFSLPPDHIAVELEFTSFLFFKEIEGIRTGNQEIAEYARELQAVVIDKHLRPFVLNLAEKVATHARTAFYRVMAGAMKQYYE